MNLQTRLSELIRACFAGIYIETFEPEEAIIEIAELCREENWNVATWDIESGLNALQANPNSQELNPKDPLSAIRSLNGLASPDGASILVMKNLHRFMGSAEVVQAISEQLIQGKLNRTILVILSPVIQLPLELQKQFVVVTHELPSREQLLQIAQSIVVEEDELPSGPELERVLDASSGLTRNEAENAFSLSLIRHDRITPEVMWELKTQTLKKSGLLSLHQGNETFSEIGGLQAVKEFCLKALEPKSDTSNPVRPKGCLLLGIPGTGKSFFAKALGNEIGRPTLSLDLGSLMGSLVGQTEERTRQALQIADAMAPCILFLDEVEKGLSGASGGSSGDNGVSSRMLGTFLSWLSDHTTDVFVICTANDVSKLPPEFTRAERFDGIWFLDLPTKQDRAVIWDLYLDKYGLDKNQPLPADDTFTGAEIKSCCRLSALLNISLSEAALNVIPIAKTSQESVTQLREWASGRCLSADHPGVYHSGTYSYRNRLIDPSSN